MICEYCGLETAPLAYHEGYGECQAATKKLAALLRQRRQAQAEIDIMLGPEPGPQADVLQRLKKLENAVNSLRDKVYGPPL